jgi:hypothetical protein
MIKNDYWRVVVLRDGRRSSERYPSRDSAELIAGKYRDCFAAIGRNDIVVTIKGEH